MPPEPNSWIPLAYLVAAVLFILGLKGLTHPRSAVRGNFLGALGMLVATVTALFDAKIFTFGGGTDADLGQYGLILVGVGLLIGTIGGVLMATRIQMTDMPQFVALLNGFGGIASLLVAGGAVAREAFRAAGPDGELIALGLDIGVATAASGLIGAVTFTGSLVAFGKLQGLISGNAILLPMRHVISIVLGALMIIAAGFVVTDPSSLVAYGLLIAVALAMGILLVIPIGGADMPVVIALLNSYSGLAAAATGFVINNSVLIISGSLVGSSGLILTQIMCKAMNRSLVNVMFGTLGGDDDDDSPKQDDVYAGRIKSTSSEELALVLDTARRVVIVPGYGLAVAQAQHAVRELTSMLDGKGVEVEFGIHPVAGRMPGHMNVLLAEADIPYDQLKEMDEINPSFRNTDVVLVIGANDVVNPLAREANNGPIAGMPILNVDQARTVVVI